MGEKTISQKTIIRRFFHFLTVRQNLVSTGGSFFIQSFLDPTSTILGSSIESLEECLIVPSLFLLLNRLIIASDEKGQTASMLRVMHCLAKKGVLMKSNSIESIVKAAVPCDPAVYDKTLYYVAKVRGEEEMRLLAEKYPNVPAVAEVESDSVPAAESADADSSEAAEEAEEGAKKDP